MNPRGKIYLYCGEIVQVFLFPKWRSMSDFVTCEKKIL